MTAMRCTFHNVALSILLAMPVMSSAQSMDDRSRVPRDGTPVLSTMPADSIIAPALPAASTGLPMLAGHVTSIAARDPLPWELVHGEADAGPLPAGVVRMSAVRGTPSVPER
ncbi:MAG: hypothetical protein KIT10_05610 [Flavobacteriales bacterium]|nr:hypothetical protein [Flavobacteriales bacterium]